MVRNVAASVFADSRRLRQFWIAFAISILILPSVLTHLFLWRLERCLDLKIISKPFFTPIPGFVSVRKGLRLEWREQLKITSGSLSVHFPLTGLVTNRFPIALEGKNLTVQPGLGFRKMIGQKEIFFDRFSAKFFIDSRRISDIEYLNAESKMMEFHLNPKPLTKA